LEDAVATVRTIEVKTVLSIIIKSTKKAITINKRGHPAPMPCFFVVALVCAVDAGVDDGLYDHE